MHYKRVHYSNHDVQRKHVELDLLLLHNDPEMSNNEFLLHTLWKRIPKIKKDIEAKKGNRDLQHILKNK